jgi:hypothetical protein
VPCCIHLEGNNDEECDAVKEFHDGEACGGPGRPMAGCIMALYKLGQSAGQLWKHELNHVEAPRQLYWRCQIVASQVKYQPGHAAP